MNNNQSINRLIVNAGTVHRHPLIESIPVLKPPHTITGISAGVISQLNTKLGRLAQVVALVLNSEGQPGFERSDNDAIMDACFVIGKLVDDVDEEAYVKSVSSAVRKFSGFSNSGMYI